MIKSREEYSSDIENQYKRMERAYGKVLIDFESTTFSKSSEERLDGVYDFFLVCYHLREWIKKDDKVTLEIKNNVPAFEGDNSKIQFQICRDLCNKSKHAILEETKKYKPNDVNIKIILNGSAFFKVPGKELSEANNRKETIHLKDGDSIFIGDFWVFFKGDKYELKGVVQACMSDWKKFFEKNDLLLPRSTPYSE